MITKIGKIRDFGSFEDYTWCCTKEFSKVNLFFGWNYSGKTTLSRIFSSFEKKQNRFENSHFSLITDGATITEETLDKYQNIRVFNRDYIKANLIWDSSEAEPFVILGEESNNLKVKLKEQEDLKEKSQKVFDNNKNEIERITKEIKSKCSDCAKSIKENLGEVNYDRTKLEKDIGDLPKPYDRSIIKSDEYNKCFKTITNSDKKNILEKINFQFLDLNAEYTTISALCNQTVTSERIQSLIDDESLSKWVEDGLKINEGYDHCRFCGSILKPDVLKKYHRHFSDEYARLQSDLNSKEELLNASLLEKTAYVKEQFYPELSDEFNNVKREVDTDIDSYNAHLKLLIGMIDKKLKSLFTKIDCPSFEYVLNRKSFDSYNELIERNTTKTNDFEEEQKKARERLIHHTLASFVRDSDYFKINKKLSDLDSQNRQHMSDIETIEKGIAEIKIKMSNTEKAAERINEVLREYYGRDDIKLKNEGEKFFIYRNGVKAKDLSEGEQTAIAFSYFIASLDGCKTSDLTIFIDDPISSFDSNHLFFTYSMIHNRFCPEKQLLCKQLFISTHNYEFFTHLRKGICLKKQQKADPNPVSLFMIKRENNDKSRKSLIVDLPSVLRDYDSEYVYLFNRALEFINSDDDGNFDQIYDMPNIMRKILDMYSAFKYQNKFEEVKDKIFPDKCTSGRVYKFINHESHARSDGLMQLSDLSECRTVVELALDGIKKDDPDHYESVIKKCEYRESTCQSMRSK